ncbi:Dolichyl-phosphate-mannose-protein mannosyltransferase [Butyrivibrio sp. YAB3001]|nr:Dolichyl-phosphate-mannose-protein mannosyltransferase [Butyrivibrio sp. YAB3001]
MAATLFIIGMAAYYMWRMFAITPQHEELVSYCLFIEKGPLYSAMNWPSANNHVGYSVLASILNLFGNSYVGLRGVSYICAVLNLVIVYHICKKYFTHAMPFAAVVLYASMQVVNEYSVQGRGYTLGTFCFLMTALLLTDVCRAVEDKNYQYVLIVIFMVYGMYTIPISFYWAIPTAFTAVIFLFINGFRSRRVYASDVENIYLRKLNAVLTSVFFCAIITFLLYTVLWLTIGSKELISDSSSLFYGETDFTVLLRNPMLAMRRGMNYMKSQREFSLDSVNLFKDQFFLWIKELLNYMIPGLWLILLGFIVSGLCIMVAECLRHFEYSRTVLNLLVIINLLYIFLILIVTHNLPPLKGFGYGSFLMTICVCSTIEKILNVLIRVYNSKISKKDSDYHNENERVIKNGHWYDGLVVYTPVILIMVLFFARMMNKDFYAQIGIRENDIFNTMYIADISRKSNPCVLDEDQLYLLKFGFDIDCNKKDVTGADIVILDRNMTVPGYRGEYSPRWFQTFETIDWDYLDTMHIKYENESIILYTK